MPYFVSYASQKGGPGKTTLSVYTATYLFHQQVKVAVLDADFPQYSFNRYRQRDLRDLQLADAAQRGADVILAEKKLIPYPISLTTVAEAAITLPKLASSKELQFVFVDLPGTLNVAGMDTLLLGIDLMILPCELEFGNITSALETMEYMTRLRPGIRFGLLWTKIKKPYHVAYRQEVEKTMQRLFNVRIFEYIFYNTVQIAQQINTLVPMSDRAAPLVQELIEFLSENQSSTPARHG